MICSKSASGGVHTSHTHLLIYLCYNFSMQRRFRRSQQKQIHWKLLLFLLSLIVIGGLAASRRGSEIISPLPKDDPTVTNTDISLLKKKKTPAELEDLIKNIVGTTWKNYSIYIKDLSSPFEVGINETVMYPAASVNKIPILASLYTEAQQKNVDLDKQITVQAKDIQDYGSGIIRNDPPGGTYTVKTLARLMMQQSDNTAAYILSVHVVPNTTTQKFVNAWGLTQTDMDENTTSNKDMALLLTKIYTGGLVNTAYTQEMLSFLKDSDYEERIPGSLPPTATAYHKTGDAIAALHDVGIVTDDKLRYYIGIFTGDITDEEETKKLMAKISKFVYDYLK